MDVPLLALILFCILMSGFFSATETAYSTLNRIRIKTLAEDGNKRAENVLQISQHFDFFISTVLVGNNIVNILATSLATVLCIRWFGNASGPSISTVAMTVLVLIFGEVTPKTLANKYPEKYALATVNIIRVIGFILYPISFIIGQWQKLLSKIFKNEEDQGITEEELISIIEEAEEDGNVEKDVSELLKSAIEFNDLEVGDVYTPNIDVTFANIDSTHDEIKQIFTSSEYSRIPVYKDTFDNVIGLLYYKDFFEADGNVQIDSILKPTMFVSKTQKISELLKTLQKNQLHMAIVADEYGSTAGIITLEDIIEEIVGEIWDEYDNITEDITKIGENEYIVSGKANIEKVFDEFDIDLQAEAKTANGWAMEMLGRIATEGDVFETAGLSAEVLKMNGRRIENLKIIVSSEDPQDAPEEEKD